MSSSKRTLSALLLGLALLCAVLAVWGVDILLESRPSILFRRYVLYPIPDSVVDIRVAHPKRLGGFGYVFRFGIDRADIELILEAQPIPFCEAQMTKYTNDGTLYLRWKGPLAAPDGHAFGLYGAGDRPPWFDLAAWHDPEVYALVNQDDNLSAPDIQVLIYNAATEQAYFIVFDYGGDAVWG